MSLEKKIELLEKRIEKLEKDSHPPRDLIKDLIRAIKRGDKDVIRAIRTCAEPFRMG